MITLIAESKTMSGHMRDISPDDYLRHAPSNEREAELIIDSLRGYSHEELAEAVGISLRHAISLRKMIYDFADRSRGMEALKAFTGVVFRQLDVEGLSNPDYDFMQGHLRIVSSLYGLLRPADIIRPYRLDYGTRVAPGGETLSRSYKSANTVEVMKLVKDGAGEVVNLLPGEAMKAIDWRALRRCASVYAVDFKYVDAGGELKTPPSTRLKELRGRMLRVIMERRIDSVGDLRLSDFPGFVYDSEPTEGVLRFIAD